MSNSQSQVIIEILPIITLNMTYDFMVGSYLTFNWPWVNYYIARLQWQLELIDKAIM